MSTDGSRWSMQHDLWINDELLAAKIDLDGAWLNTLTRKLTAVPESVIQVFNLAFNNNEKN
jgi:acyl-CoA thioester hydrolase